MIEVVVYPNNSISRTWYEKAWKTRWSEDLSVLAMMEIPLERVVRLEVGDISGHLYHKFTYRDEVWKVFPTKEIVSSIRGRKTRWHEYREGELFLRCSVCRKELHEEKFSRCRRFRFDRNYSCLKCKSEQRKRARVSRRVS